MHDSNLSLIFLHERIDSLSYFFYVSQENDKLLDFICQIVYFFIKLNIGGVMSKLEDVIPSKPEFKIGNKVYRINLFSLDDVVYYEKKYGSLEEMANMMSEGTYLEKFTLVYEQMEDRSDFQAEEIEETDRSTGKVSTRVISGPEKLLKALSLKNVLDPINALTLALNQSMPELTEEQKEIAKKKQKAVLSKKSLKKVKKKRK